MSFQCLLSLRRTFVIALAVLFAPLLVSCGFSPSPAGSLCSVFDQAPFTPLTSQSTQQVFQDFGIIAALEGSGTAKIDGTGFVKIAQSVALPGYADKATILLNGWRANYPAGDHHVANLGTAIVNIRIVSDAEGKNHSLSWIATGSLADDGWNKGMNWSYFFTVIAWNSAQLNLTVDHGTAGNDSLCSPPANPEGELLDNYFSTYSNSPSSAGSGFYSFIQNSGFPFGKSIAVLPRGFDFMWLGGDDHHLRQVSYNIDHSEVFAEQRKYAKKGGTASPDLPDSASHVGAGVVSWNSNVIFKDNDTRRDYRYSEVDSGLGGPDVGVMQPPFSSVPTDDGSSLFFNGCGSLSSNGIQRRDFVIDGIPYAYAIPMLTAWDLQYSCDDQHVKEIGVWIDRWEFVTPIPGGPGRIRYRLSSVLRDDDNHPDFGAAHKVTILGLRPIAVTPVPPVLTPPQEPPKKSG